MIHDFPVDIYPVTCEALSSGRSDLEVLEGVAAGGAKVIQLREKKWDRLRLYETAMEFRRITRTHGMLLIINDWIDLAQMVEADGVHLGRNDLPIREARRIAPDLIIGASSHSLDEALEAQDQGATYVNIGPIFATGTKPGAIPLGPDITSEIAPHLHIPFTVMGGINVDNIEKVLSRGATRIAMVSGITGAPDIPQRVRDLRQLMRSGRLDSD